MSLSLAEPSELLEVEPADPPTLPPEEAPEAPTPHPALPDELRAPVERVIRWALGGELPDLSPPSPLKLALASLGFGTACAAAALSLPLSAAPSVAVAGLVAALGTAVLTGPALLILHQFLGLQARPIDIISALSRGFADAGQVALGLTPFVLLLSLTSRLGLPALLLCCAGLGALTLGLTHRRLLLLEARSAEATWRTRLTMLVLATAWGGLAALVSGRLALGLLLPAIFP